MSTLFGFTDPFSDLLEMQRQMDTLMNTFTTTFDMPLLTGVDVGDVSGGRGRLTTTPAPTRTKATKKRMWRPQLDVCETQNSLVLHAELPGCNKEDIKLSVTDDNRLVLEGRKRTHKKEKGENWLRRERFWGTFYRTLPLPSGVDVQQIQANYENGVLDVVIPKPQAATSGKKQTIDIKTAEPGATSQITQPQEKGEQRELQPQQVEQPKAEQEKPEETQKPLEEKERKTQQPREEKPEETQQPQEEREQQEVLPQQVEQPKAEQEKPEETQKPQEEKEREETQQLREEKPEETQQPQEEREQQEVRPQQPKAEQEKPEETQKPLKEEREQQPQLVEQPMPEETQMPLEKEQPTARTEEQAPTEQEKAEEQKGKPEEKIQEQKDESSIFIGAQSQGQQL